MGQGHIGLWARDGVSRGLVEVVGLEEILWGGPLSLSSFSE